MGEPTGTMKGVELTGHGGFEKLRLRSDLRIPQPRADEVLIKVSAAAINNTDINTRIGWYSKSGDASKDAAWTGDPIKLPLIQGADACGQIVAVGTEVQAERIGERILVEPCMQRTRIGEVNSTYYFGSDFNGAFAEYTVVPSVYAHKINSELTDSELASFPCSYSAAENMLTRAQLKQGERVLVTGASGGVGSAAVQLAKARGAEVIAVCAAEKSASLLELGADRVIDREAHLLERLGSNCIDLIIDVVAGDQWHELLDILKPKGRYAVAGAIGGARVELDLRTLYLKDLSLLGCTSLEPEVFPNLIRLIETGAIRPVVAGTFPLEQIIEAQKKFLEKRHVGKIVLEL